MRLEARLQAAARRILMDDHPHAPAVMAWALQASGFFTERELSLGAKEWP